MDNFSQAADDQGISWGPKLVAIIAAGVVTAGAAAATAWFGMAGDGPGAVLFGAITLFFAVLTSHGAIVRPRLIADQDGVTVRTTAARRWAPWKDVDSRIATTRRFGREAVTLELDINEPGSHEPTLIVLGQLELGADPREVLDQLKQQRS